MEAAGRAAQDAYVSAIVGPASAGKLRLSVAASVGGESSLRCGHRAIDTELVIVARALQRLKNHLHGDLGAQVDLDMIHQSATRIAKVLRLLGIQDAANAEMDFFEATCHVKEEREVAGRSQPVNSSGADSDEEANSSATSSTAAESPRSSLVCSALVALASNAPNGTYLFSMTPDNIVSNAERLLRDAKPYDMQHLVHRLIDGGIRKPRIRLRGIPAPLDGRTHSSCAADESFLASTPLGIVNYVQRMNLPCVPLASSSWGRCKVEDIISKGVTFFMTQSMEKSYVLVDFVETCVIPTAYAFSSIHHILPGYFPRTWQFQGSADGTHWFILARHVDDQSFSAKRTSVVFRLKEMRSPRAFRYFRILNLGPNSSGTHELQVTGLEVYGSAITVEPDEPLMTRPLAGGTSRALSIPLPEPMIDITLAASSKKAAKKK